MFAGPSQEISCEPGHVEKAEWNDVEFTQRLFATEDACHHQHDRPQEDDQKGEHTQPYQELSVLNSRTY